MGISSLDLTSAVRLRVFLHRRHIHLTFFILLFQAWAWTGSSIHPFLKRTNSPDQKEGVITDFQTNVSHNSSSAHRPIVFGQNWATAFANDNLGCQSGRGSFMWRGQGFGSNINNLLNAWVYAIAVENWTDMAVVINSGQMTHVECGKESGGEASIGWECLFSPMPHLCTFETAEEWTDYMKGMHVSKKDLEEAVSLDQNAVRFHPEKIVESLKEVDHFEALAAMAQYLWAYMTPWLKRDMKIVTSYANAEVFEESPYIGLHIRRGDKIANREASYHSSEEYMVAAVDFIEMHSNEIVVEDIKGIWVASDDPAAVDEVRAIAPAFFPNVSNGTIVWATGGVPQGPAVSTVKTRTDKQNYAQLVYMFADLHQLTHASLFVGTFSSNIGRLVALLRLRIGRKSTKTTVSLDRDGWTPGRRRHTLERPR